MTTELAAVAQDNKIIIHLWQVCHSGDAKGELSFDKTVLLFVSVCGELMSKAMLL